MTVYEAIPGEYKMSKLNTQKKFNIWSQRVDKPTEEEQEHIKKQIEELCSKGVIGVKETGKHKEHYHMAFSLRKEKSQSATAKTFIINQGQKVHMEDYCLLPSAHYFSKEAVPEAIFTYAIKKGVLFNHRFKTEEAKEEVKNNRLRRINEFCEQYNIDKDEVNLVKYEKAIQVLGIQKAKELFPTIHYSANGVRIQKDNVNDKHTLDVPSCGNQWITGPPGTGKTSFLDVLHPGRYTKNKDTKFWESFNYQDTSTNNNHMCVHFDELGTVQDMLNMSGGVSQDQFKLIFQDAPFTIEIKHGAQQTVRFRKGIVTGNDSWQSLINQVYKQCNNDNHTNPLRGFSAGQFKAAIERRFTFVDISEVLDTYNCFTIKKTKFGLGGCFHKSFRDVIYKKHNDYIKEAKERNKNGELKAVVNTDLRRKCIDLAKKYKNKTIKELEPQRWMSYEDVKSNNISNEEQDKIYDEELLFVDAVEEDRIRQERIEKEKEEEERKEKMQQNKMMIKVLRAHIGELENKKWDVEKKERNLTNNNELKVIESLIDEAKKSLRDMLNENYTQVAQKVGNNKQLERSQSSLNN